VSNNVQLAGREVSVVWLDADSKRIIGFAPEGARPVAPSGTRLKCYTLLHASELDRWMKKYREQNNRDREEATVRKLESERPMRDAIRAAVLERNNGLDPWNRDINLSMLRSMDTMYERVLNSRRKQEAVLVAEQYEAGKTSADVAADSPIVRRESNG
jgi:hypothetical protein